MYHTMNNITITHKKKELGYIWDHVLKKHSKLNNKDTSVDIIDMGYNDVNIDAYEFYKQTKGPDWNFIITVINQQDMFMMYASNDNIYGNALDNLIYIKMMADYFVMNELSKNCNRILDKYDVGTGDYYVHVTGIRFDHNTMLIAGKYLSSDVCDQLKLIFNKMHSLDSSKKYLGVYIHDRNTNILEISNECINEDDYDNKNINYIVQVFMEKTQFKFQLTIYDKISQYKLASSLTYDEPKYNINGFAGDHATLKTAASQGLTGVVDYKVKNLHTDYHNLVKQICKLLPGD